MIVSNESAVATASADIASSPIDTAAVTGSSLDSYSASFAAAAARMLTDCYCCYLLYSCASCDSCSSSGVLFRSTYLSTDQRTGCRLYSQPVCLSRLS